MKKVKMVQDSLPVLTDKNTMRKYPCKQYHFASQQLCVIRKLFFSTFQQVSGTSIVLFFLGTISKQRYILTIGIYMYRKLSFSAFRSRLKNTTMAFFTQIVVYD